MAKRKKERKKKQLTQSSYSVLIGFILYLCKNETLRNWKPPVARNCRATTNKRLLWPMMVWVLQLSVAETMFPPSPMDGGVDGSIATSSWLIIQYN